MEILFYIFFGLFVIHILIWFLQFIFFIFLVIHDWREDRRYERAQKIVDEYESTW